MRKLPKLLSNRLIDADTQQQMAAAQQLLCAGHRQRVCRAWHESSRVEVPVPSL